MALLQTGRRLLPFLCPKHKMTVVQAANKVNFFDPDVHSGYSVDKNKPSTLEHTKHGRKLLLSELKKFAKEQTYPDRNIIKEHGDYLVQFKFDNKETVDDWVVTSDNDNLEGYSHCEFLLSKNRTGLWKGYVNNQVPKNGIVTRTGYCNITSPYNYKSFRSKIPYDWTDFTHLVFRVRGDGRRYLINLKILSELDISWCDIYTYTLFTRGGPYWEEILIPFSKFYLASKGRIQDHQEPVAANRIATIGFTMCEDFTGPFQLEIDYIATLFDGSHSEEFAYEQYEYDQL